MTSFKRDGPGVATPVWFGSDATRLFAFTDLQSAKGEGAALAITVG